MKCTLPYVGNTKKYLKRGVKLLMPTKLKGMTSLEIAIIVAIVLAIAVAAAWYLYSTFSATIGSSPIVAVRAAYAFSNGTIRVELMNTGGSTVVIGDADVLDKRFGTRAGGFITVPPGANAVVYIDTGLPLRPGSIIQGKLNTRSGHVIPFSARVLY